MGGRSGPAAATVLMMAGGRGHRMRLSYGEVPKPLVPVRGVPLLERNLLTLLGGGFRDIVVAVPAALAEIGGYLADRGAALAAALGARLEVLVEREPLGTIGAAGLLRGRSDAVLVVNADNLSALDLPAMVRAHRERDAALTVASHVEPFRVPFGQLILDDGDRVTAYREKPALPVRVSSGTYVLGPRAISALGTGIRADVPQLVDALLALGAPVRAFLHEAPWIDVNDAAAVARAAALIAAHEEAFERWSSAPDREVAGAVLRGPAGVLLERRRDDAAAYPGVWDTPGGKLELGEAPLTALLRELREELDLDLGGDGPAPRRLCTFDDLDLSSGRVFRHHVFLCELDEARARRIAPREGQRIAWLALDGGGPGVASLGPLCPIVSRSLAALAAEVPRA